MYPAARYSKSDKLTCRPTDRALICAVGADRQRPRPSAPTQEGYPTRWSRSPRRQLQRLVGRQPRHLPAAGEVPKQKRRA
jgi:hypothetical protein